MLSKSNLLKDFSNQQNEADILNTAIQFACKKHCKQFRKGTSIPYIVHPLEVLQILYSMRADTNLMIAGLLHDTVEDTDTSYEEIRELFGEDVEKLVASNSEDKTKSWLDRKQHTINELSYAPQRVKMLIMADKLSNMRSIAFDFKNIGDELWSRFNAPKEKQAWYYSGVQDALYDMQLVPECADVYWEFVGLFKDVFVRFRLDEENQILYQECDDGSVYCLEKGNPEWLDKRLAESLEISSVCIDESVRHYFKTGIIPESAVIIARKEAELLEDIWAKPFWDCHSRDMADASYKVFDSESRSIVLKISGEVLSLECEDCIMSCNDINGSDGYDFSYILSKEDSHKLLVRLRLIHGISKPLEKILKEEFGHDEGSIQFRMRCSRAGIRCEFFSY